MLIHRVRSTQAKRGHNGFERRAVFADHVVGPLHGSKGRRQRASRCIFKGFTRGEDWLSPDNSRALDLFNFALGIGDRPVTRQQLSWLRTLVDDVNFVDEKPMSLFRSGMFRRIFGRYANLDAFGGRLRCRQC